MVQEFAHAEMASLIRRRLLEESFDLVQCEYLAMAQYAPAQYLGATILTEHQVHGAAGLRDLRRLPMGWRSLRRLGSALKTMAYELSVCGRFDGVISLTPEDAQRLRPSLPDSSLSVIPTGVNGEVMRPDGVAPVQSDLLYVGYFGHEPNVDAVRWFAARMWPQIRRRRPQTTWTIAGTEALESLGALAQQPNIRVVGWVPDLRPYLAGCHVFLVPVRLGGGIRGKIMEAWAMGCAVVSTSLGCEGTQARDGVQALIADTPEAFAAAVLRLLEDEPMRRALGEAGRWHVEQHFDWAQLAQAHEQFYVAVLQRKGRRGIAASEPDEVVATAGTVLGDRDA
jgi:glycosyltransferase involved in cell wall biosynthesis